MDFALTEDQKMLKAMLRDFTTKELEPIAAQIDEEARFPAESIKKMAELGLMGIPFPEEYGGSGGGPLEFAIVEEELSRVCASTGTIYFVTAGLAGKPLYRFGNEEQRQRFVVPVAKGEKLACFALTEAGAGSDIASLETTAARQNGGYILNGSKLFITNGNEADIVVIFATIGKSLRHRGITAFIVEKGTPGFSVGKLEHKLGRRASSTAELIFEDCFVPEANRLGKEGEGFRIALEAIDSSRQSVAAQAVGIAQGAFDKCLAYAKERQQFGQPIANFQAIQWMLADMATQIDAARLLTYRAAYLEARGLPFVKEASMAKVRGGDVTVKITQRAVELLGPLGYSKEHLLEKWFRDAKINDLYEGTGQINRLIVARRILDYSRHELS